MRRLLTSVALLGIGIAAAAEGARYLIICNDNYLNSMRPLAEWKHAKGMQTKLVPQSQVGNDTAAIKSYIRNAYNTWPVRPEFVLLVGSPSQIPARRYQLQQGLTYYSDNLYGDMSGDLRQEIPVGRFPCKSTTQCDLMVAKTLSYEQNPDIADTSWMRTMTTVCRDLGDDDAYVYWNDIRNAINQARSNGFIRFDSLASSRGDTASDVEASVTSGTGMVLYRGTATANWYRPFAVNPALCNSGKRLPITLSITCETMTLAPGESMVGEAWLKAGTVTNPKGAVAFFGNTHSSSNVAQVRSAVARGFFTGLFSERRWHLGHAYLRAKEQLYAEFPSYTSDYRGFNLLGDPELGIWTDLPHLPEVSHPAQIEPSPQSVPVTVALNGVPVESALVCLSMDTTVYVWGYTDRQGAANLAVNPVDTGLMRLVVTGRNLYPYDTTIHVGEVGIRTDGSAVTARQQLVVSPSVFANTTMFHWSENDPATIHICDATGRLVRTITAKGKAEWNGTDQNGHQVPPGVYIARRVCGPFAVNAHLSKLK